MVVIDCSIAISEIMPDESSGVVTEIMDHIEKERIMPLVPLHFKLEYMNGLLSARRRKRITAMDMKYFLLRWLYAPLEIDQEGDPERIVALAEQYDLTIYDASYLELAIRRNAVLATLDATLAKAAKKEKRLFVA